MAALQRFSPHYGGGQVVSATSTSAQATVAGSALGLRITNFDAANVAYVKVGSGTFTASTADYPIRPNSEIWVTKPYGADKVAYYSLAGSSLHIIEGEGF